MIIIGIFDKKLEAFIPQLTLAQPTVGAACRFVEDELSRSPIGRHPDDYVLMQLAKFDDTSGVLTDCEPRTLYHVSELIKAPVVSEVSASVVPPSAH